MTLQRGSSDAAPSEAAVLSAYQAIVQRRIQRDSLIWQVPALCLTAQAFLLQFALDSSKGPTARAMASTLSCLTAIACIQLMARHRIAEVDDSRTLENMEENSLRLQKPYPHEKPNYAHSERKNLDEKAEFAIGMPSLEDPTAIMRATSGDHVQDSDKPRRQKRGVLEALGMDRQESKGESWPISVAATSLYFFGQVQAFLVWSAILAVFAIVGIGTLLDSVWVWVR